MLRTKWMDRAACVVTALMLAAAVLLWGFAEPRQGMAEHSLGYESRLFDQSTVHTIDIYMDDWDTFIANATAEEYADCSIVIDGERMNHVAIRAKGNTSLTSVETMGSTRYSFKVEFDHYVSDMTYHGLDKLSLNNLIYDATMMKDYLSFTLMNRMDVPSSLCSYVQINVNGEPWGLYLAVEGVEDGFLTRNGLNDGELYKPDSLSFGGGRGNGRDFDMDQFRNEHEEQPDAADVTATPEPQPDASDATAPVAPQRDEGGSSGMPSGMPQMPGGDFQFPGGDGAEMPRMPSGDFQFPGGDNAGMPDMSSMPSPGEMPDGANGEHFAQPDAANDFASGMGSDDVHLLYIDDDPDSYANIFDNAKTKVSEADQTRLIESLLKLNAQEDIADVVDMDEVIRYLAVHHFLCNDDSYTGSMVHNYYLYERDGQLAIFPWDYNLAFGGFSVSDDATSAVNAPIDSPVTSGTTASRPLIAWIFEDEEALASYHETYSRFIEETIESGWLAEEISRVQAMIAPYLEQDTSAFYDMDEFEKAVETLQTFCAKRDESIRGQLEGTIPSTSEGQKQNAGALVDASDISTADMGSMNVGGGGHADMPGGDHGGDRGKSDRQDGKEFKMPAMPDGNTSATFTVPDSKDSAMPTMPDGEASAMPTMPDSNQPPSDQSGGMETPKIEDGAAFAPMDMQQTPQAGFEPNENSRNHQSDTWLQVALWLAVLLAAGFILHCTAAHNR